MTHHELESWYEEKQSAYLYRIVSDAESGTPRQVLFLELASAAEKQAGLGTFGMNVFPNFGCVHRCLLHFR